MKRKVVVAFFVSSMLSLAMLGILFVTPVKAQHDMAGIYFDRSIYYPDVRVFWEPNLSVPIEIRVVDRDVKDNYVKVNVSSSIDSKEVTLTKDILGVFSGTVFAVGAGLMGEPILNTSSLNVRYGDEIIAEYFDMSSGNNFMASALFVFPHYIMQTCLNSVDNWESASNCVFDSDGVPMVDYGGGIGLQYNPVTISQYALANYYTYLNEGNTTRREKFLAQAKWLVENAKQKGNFSVWEYNFDNLAYGCTKPWVSALSQGEGLSVLARAYVLTGNISYIDVAEEIILAFQVEMSAGGVRYTDSDGVWFEEAADVGAPSSKVFNGFMFALTALYEYSFETNNSKGWTFFWEGAETLSNNTYRYDSGSWSYYDLLYYSHASLTYHKHHIEQLRTLYELTGDEIFLYYSDKFESYISPPPPPPPPLTPENTITVYTLPSGVTFTVNNVSYMTPWSEAYENGTLVSLVMPETHTVGDSRYYWDQWSDGNTSRSRTFTMDTNITLAAYLTRARRVPTDYPTIQEAINAANPGNTIYVHNGTYYEHVVVNKTVSLIGENKDTTVIDGSGTGTVVSITANRTTVSGFTVKNGTYGIDVAGVHSNVIRHNTMANNEYGICLDHTYRNIISGNTITNNGIGIYLDGDDNVIFHNNFIYNSEQVIIPPYYWKNIWDDGYPSGGNYWSDYTGVDMYSGPYQNQTGPDGIGDTPYTINVNNTDNYPLISPWSPVTIRNTTITKGGTIYPIRVVSNATILDFKETRGSLRLNVSGANGTSGYIRVIQPIGLNSSKIKVFLNNTRLTFPSYDSPASISRNSTHYFIYFAFTFNSVYELTIAFPIEGDVNYDGEVNIEDIVTVAIAYGSKPGAPNWNLYADLNQDETVNIKDIVMVAIHYGETYQ